MSRTPSATTHTQSRQRWASLAVAAVLLLPAISRAGPWIDTGRSDLRSDILLLADAGVITGPVSSWPLAWGDIINDLDGHSIELTDWESAALMRVRQAASRDMRTNELLGHARLAIAAKPVQIRSFENTPREDAEVELGASWTGDRFAFRLQGSWVDDPRDGRQWRADGSYAAVALGNWTLALSAQDRWWGPGWQGSLALSNNARPFPAISLERNSTRAFESKWLSWIGPWDLSLFHGQLESDRWIPNAWITGVRVNFRPLPSLEIGFNRTAQWCGDDRSCGLSTFKDVVFGNDNVGFNVSAEDEPGNQLAGWDARWSGRLFSQRYAIYTQWSGEDRDGYHPSKNTGLFGLELAGGLAAGQAYRVFLEYVDTECNFNRGFNGDPRPNCKYNNGLYRTGYRYYQRSIGHSLDNDSRVMTLGGVLSDTGGGSWLGRLGYGKLNRSGPPDVRNTLVQVKHDYWEASVAHRRSFSFGEISAGAGYEYRKNRVTNTDDSDARLWLEWTYRTW